MQEPFDFEKIGKKMPYSVPENFFDTMEENVLSALAATNTHQLLSSKKSNRRKWMYLTTGAVAAVALLLLTVRIFLPKQAVPDGSYEQVEMAFNQLSAEDQAYLLDVYEDDVFIEEDI